MARKKSVKKPENKKPMARIGIPDTASEQQVKMIKAYAAKHGMETTTIKRKPVPKTTQKSKAKKK